jgi:hypothetical protein
VTLWWVALAVIVPLAPVAAVYALRTIDGRPLRTRETKSMNQNDDLIDGMKIIGDPLGGLDAFGPLAAVARDTEQRQNLAEMNRRHLDEFVQVYDAHVVNVPGCASAPLCIGPAAIAALGLRERLRPGYAMFLLLTAVTEMSRLRRQLDAEHAYAAQVDRELVEVCGRLTDAEERLKEMR